MSSPDHWCRRVVVGVAHSCSLYGGKNLDEYDTDDSFIDNEAVENDEEESGASEEEDAVEDVGEDISEEEEEETKASSKKGKRVVKK